MTFAVLEDADPEEVEANSCQDGDGAGPGDDEYLNGVESEDE